MGKAVQREEGAHPVFIGRFQPFHKGHLDVIKDISKKGSFTIIIGSMQEFCSDKNPFTFAQRKEMIESALAFEGIWGYAIQGVPDFYDDIKWAQKVKELFGKKKICVYTRNPWTKKCLDAIGAQTIENELYGEVSSTLVRGRIREGLRWEKLVPKKVESWLKANRGLEIIKESGKLPEERVIEFIRQSVSKTQSKGAVLGLSGGIDSSVAAELAKKALGRRAVFLSLPVESDESPNLKQIRDRHEAQKISLGPAYSSFLESLPDADKRSKGNLQSRLRMAALYYYANKEGLLVLGTTNKSEFEIGYFTKYGDGGADVEPLAGIYKTEIIEMAKRLNLPEEIIKSEPSAGLWEGQTDEGELGLNYSQIDTILKLREQGFPSGEITELTLLPKKKVNYIFERISLNRHKREIPPVCEIKCRLGN
jgi:NAD+ synthase